MSSITSRVVTRDFNPHGNGEPKYTVMFEGSRTECMKFILSRWGHRPPFAAVTGRKSGFDNCF